MNSLLAWFNSPEWMIVVKTLLHTLWQAGGFALLLWIMLRRATTPATRYRLTLGTLAAILGTTLLTWAVLNQSTPTAPDFELPITPPRSSLPTPRVANFGEPSVIAYSTPIPKPAEETRWSGWLALAWLLGSALMLTRAGVQVAGAERLRRSCKPLDDSHITQLLAEAQRALNLTRRIRVAVTDKLTSPAVVGVIVPTLILPLTLLTTLTPEQIRFILLHEIAHIRRGDYFANLFQLFIEALLFFNPAVWWISHQVRREREACCDALAIELSGAPVDYARTLLHVAETVLNPPPAAAPAFSDNPREPSSLTDRVQRLLVPGYRPALRLTWRAMLAAIVVGGTLLFLSAIGARNVVGAVSTNSSEKATKPATNVVENAAGKTPESKTNLANTNIRHVRGNAYEFTDGGSTVTVDIPSHTVGDNSAPLKEFDTPPVGMSHWQISEQQLPAKQQWFYYRVKPSPAETNSPSTHGDSLVFHMFQYDDDSQTEPDVVHKQAADLINLSNYGSLPDPDIKLRSLRKRITGPLVFTTVNYGDDGTNAQVFQPLETRVFTIDLNKYAAVVRKLAGMPESTPLSNTYPLFRMFLTNAGVNLDDRALGRTFFFSDSRGDVDIRATKDELDAIEKLLQPLAGVPLIHRTFQISPETLAQATHTLPPNISTILATNPVAGLRALLESFDPSDPRPKRVQYKPETGEITARATAADLKKFDAALNAKGQELIHLANRSFHADPNMMAQALGIISKDTAAVGLLTSNFVLTEPFQAATNAAQIRYAVSNTFNTIGVDLNPALGKTFLYNDRTGTILVRATENDLDLIETYIAKNTTPPPQVNIKIRWVEIPQSVAFDLFRPNLTNSSLPPILRSLDPSIARLKNMSGILSETQMAEIKKRIERREGIELLSEGQVTTLTERQAQITVSEIKTIVTGFSTNKNASVEPEAQPVALGPVFDVLPTVTSDGSSIRLEVIPTFTEFVGYDTNTANQPAPKVVNGETNYTTLPLPIFHVKQITHDAVVPDGRTLILGNLTTTEIAKQPNGEMRITDATDTQTNLLFVLVTPTIIDPAGNRAKPTPFLNR